LLGQVFASRVESILLVVESILLVVESILLVVEYIFASRREYFARSERVLFTFALQNLGLSMHVGKRSILRTHFFSD
jgi:hypothetical protein